MWCAADNHKCVKCVQMWFSELNFNEAVWTKYDFHEFSIFTKFFFFQLWLKRDRPTALLYTQAHVRNLLFFFFIFFTCEPSTTKKRTSIHGTEMAATLDCPFSWIMPYSSSIVHSYRDVCYLCVYEENICARPMHRHETQIKEAVLHLYTNTYLHIIDALLIHLSGSSGHSTLTKS